MNVIFVLLAKRAFSNVVEGMNSKSFDNIYSFIHI